MVFYGVIHIHVDYVNYVFAATELIPELLILEVIISLAANSRTKMEFFSRCD